MYETVTPALGGTPGIAIGNVVGSNIANFGLILGSCALVTAVPVASGVLRFEYPFLVLSTWIALLLCRDGWLDRLEGGFFIAAMLVFTAYAVFVARRAIGAAEQGLVGGVASQTEPDRRRAGPWLLAVGVGAALAGLLLGAHMLVEGAVALAQALGVASVSGPTVVVVLLAQLAVTWRRPQEQRRWRWRTWWDPTSSTC
jgi:cation:H+ antiporter